MYVLGQREGHLTSLSQMNDWPIRRFFSVIVALQLAMGGVMLFRETDFAVPIIGQITGFLYLTFVPGYLILRCLRLHQLGSVETPLYAVGLSLFTLMTTGFMLNFVGPMLSVHNPISPGPLMFTVSSLVLALSGLAYWRDGEYRNDTSSYSPNLSISIVLLLGFLPFLAILGTYLVRAYQNNVILMLLIPVIACIVVLIGFTSRIPKGIYPLVIFLIAITLLLHTSLISPYLTGADIHIEQHFSVLTQIYSRWDYTLEENVNTMLSTTLLCPTYSLILDMDAVWVYKIVYSLLFSLIPVALYIAYSRQVCENMAFLAVFFFIAVSSFFDLMLSLPRQQIAELFLVLYILLILNQSLTRPKKYLLSIVFLLGIAISHYALAWIYIFLFVLALVIYGLFRKTGRVSLEARPLVTAQLLGIYIGFNLLWHYVIPASTIFRDVREQIVYLATTFSSSLFKVQDSQPASILNQGILTYFHTISKFLNIIALLLLFIGVAVTLVALYRGSKEDKFSLQPEYYAIALANAIIFAMGFILPNFFMLNVSRVYHIVLLLLAPFTLIGGLVIIRYAGRFSGAPRLGSYDNAMKILSVFIALLFLFSSGFVYEVTKEHPSSISLSQNTIREVGDLRDQLFFYTDYCPEQDVYGIRWLSRHRDFTRPVFTDYRSKKMTMMSYGLIADASVVKNTTDLGAYRSYLYLGYTNTQFGVMSGPYDFNRFWEFSDIAPAANRLNVVYSSDFSRVYT